MSNPKHIDIKVNSFKCDSPNHSQTKSYFSNAYHMLSSSPNTLSKINLNNFSDTPVKKSNPVVKLMDSEIVQNTIWNNYNNTHDNVKVNPSNNEINIIKNIDVLNNISSLSNNFNLNNESILQEKIIRTKSNNNIPLFDKSFIDIKSIKNNINSPANYDNVHDPSSDLLVKKSVKNLFENKTNSKNLSQLSSQLSNSSLNPLNNKNTIKDEKGELKLNYNKTLETEAIADIVFKKQEANEVERINNNAKTNEKIEFQKSLHSCQLSLSPKDKLFESVMNNSSMKYNFSSNNKSFLTKEDFESTKVIKENARKMLLVNGARKTIVNKKPKSVKFSGENEECPFRKFESPVSVTTSPIFLTNSNIKPFLETRSNLTTFSEFKQRMIIKKPILIEKAGLLIEESEKDNTKLASFLKNSDIKKEHGVFKSRPSHVPYGTSVASYPLFSNVEKDKVRIVIQVQNLAFEKEVCVRYTFNNWLTSKDVKASYLNSLNVTSYISKKYHESTSINSNASSQEKRMTGIDDSESKVVSQSVDRFVADIEIPSYIMDFMDYDSNFFNRNGYFNSTSGEFEDDLFLNDRRRYSQSLGEEWDNDIINKCTLKFAAYYRVNNQEYWENNNNLNYTMDISRVLYIPTKKVYIRSKTPEIIKSRMVNFTNAFYNEVKPRKEYELKSILRKKVEDTTTANPVKIHHQESADSDYQSNIKNKIIAKCELREKNIRETIQKELSGSTFFKQMGINPTILNTIINSNRVSTRNNIIKMIKYYQRKAGITNPIVPIEKETSIKVEGN